MEKQMLRATLDKMDRMGYLLKTGTRVDPNYEMGAVLKHFRNKRPILFESVEGNKNKVAGGLYGDREIIYNLLRMTKEDRLYKFMDAIANPQPYKIVDRGPVKENIIKGNVDINKIFSIPRFHERDSSTYITAGAMVVKDPDTGVHFTSIRRFQVNSGDEVSALIATPKLTNDFLKLEKENKKMEVAIILGYDAEFLMASQVPSTTYGVDKYMIDSALREEPLELVKGESVDLLVPAYAEIVLEGYLVPGKRVDEGRFGELMGYYGEKAPHPVIKIESVLHRNNPIMQVSFPCREEHLSNGLIREFELYNALKNQVDVIDVNVSEGGGYRFNAFASINKRKDGDGKSAILAALGSNKDYKQVVIVDEDVDIYDVQDIEWAITTRAQASLDMVVIPGALGSSLEPSHDLRGVTDKVGIDATKPIEDPNYDFERAKIQGYDKIDIGKYFPNLK